MVTAVAERFHISGSAGPRPEVSGLVIYADGAEPPGSAGAEPHIDLSHWVPNRTAERYKADTSTEICLNYAADPDHTPADLVVNDHVDVDGVLSLYALLHSDLALAHRDVLIAAASTGDFVAWPGREGFRLAQHLGLVFVATGRSADPVPRYQQAFERVTAVLEGTIEDPPEIAGGWAELERGQERLAREVEVAAVSDRLVSFVYPVSAGQDIDRALRLPGMNPVVDDSLWLWPQVRNEHHSEQAQLVAVPHEGNWYYDLSVPGYTWAETPGRWTVPGLESTGDSNVWLVKHEPLDHALVELNAAESAAAAGAGAATDRTSGHWEAARQLTPFTSMPGRQFPVVASFVDPDGQPAPSRLTPDEVVAALTDVW
jgi:hypothetical protein